MWVVVGCGWLGVVVGGVRRRRRAHDSDRLVAALATLQALETYAALPRQRTSDELPAPVHQA